MGRSPPLSLCNDPAHARMNAPLRLRRGGAWCFWMIHQIPTV